MTATRIRVAIHGGCGNISRQGLGEARERAVRDALERSAAAAWKAAADGATALEAAVLAVTMLEDAECFNAGRGSVLNAEGDVEADAAVMEGTGLRAGAVAGLRGIRNPVRAAQAVLTDSEHVFLVGRGAFEFARNHGLEEAREDDLVVEARRRQLELAKSGGRVSLDHDENYATVGAVVRDSEGRLAAATSTGGLTNKHPGRVGDTPVIGAGTWADDRTCAVSGTGHGECFLRVAFAHTVHARVLYLGENLSVACQAALEAVRRIGGRGGVIAVDAGGNLEFAFDTPGMYRGWAGADGSPHAAIWEY